MFSKNGSLPDVIVTDETCIQVGSRQYYLYTAICPYSKRIIYFDLYTMRNHLATLTFFKQIIKLYGKRPEVVIVDGGPWYRDALNKLGIRRQVVSGSIRNYIERWFEIVKDRLRNFDIYFPRKKPGIIDTYRGKEESFKHVINWLYAFVYYYNRIRSSIRNRCLCHRCRFQNRYADRIFHRDFIESNGMPHKSDRIRGHMSLEGRTPFKYYGGLKLTASSSSALGTY